MAITNEYATGTIQATLVATPRRLQVYAAPSSGQGSYLPDRWLLVNAADAVVSLHPPTGPNALRTPSLPMACLELATYVVLLLATGAWRATRDL